MKEVSKSRWRIAQSFERSYQQRKAVNLRQKEVPFVANSMARAARSIKMLSSYLSISSDSQILEVGAGPHGTVYFLPEGRRYAMDPLAAFYWNNFHSIQRGSGVRIVCAQGEKIPFLSESFDLVITENVLDHTAYPGQVLNEILRVLRPGGVLFFGINISNFTGKTLSTFHEKVLAPIRVLHAFGPHPFCFTRSDVGQLISRIGFRILWEECSAEALAHPKSLKMRLIEILFRARYLQLICRAK